MGPTLPTGALEGESLLQGNIESAGSRSGRLPAASESFQRRRGGSIGVCSSLTASTGASRGRSFGDFLDRLRQSVAARLRVYLPIAAASVGIGDQQWHRWREVPPRPEWWPPLGRGRAGVGRLRGQNGPCAKPGPAPNAPASRCCVAGGASARLGRAECVSARVPLPPTTSHPRIAGQPVETEGRQGSGGSQWRVVPIDVPAEGVGLQRCPRSLVLRPPASAGTAH